MDLDTLPDRLKRAVADELQPGEAVRWAGRPDPARFARWAWLFVPFGVLFTGFALFWMTMAAGIAGRAGGPVGVIFPLFGLPFVLAGVAMLTSPLWVRRVGVHTAYLVTDRRAVIVQTVFGRLIVRSFGPADLTGFTRVERADGSGDVVFGRTAFRDPRGYARTRPAGFHAIPDVRRVEGLLRELAAG